MKAFRDGADDLADLLGDAHDLDELERFLHAEREALPDASRRFLLALVARRRKSLRRMARPLGRRLLAEKPKALRKRLEAYARAYLSTL